MKVLLFGATGNVGKAIAGELHQRGYDVTAVVRNPAKAKELPAKLITANVTDPSSLKGICNGFDVVISALGKSVSPSDKSKPTFDQVDLQANSAILAEAIAAGVKKFVYLSACHSELYTHLTYFRVHHQFSEKLKASGIDYAIVKPLAIFSAFKDMIAMAKNGKLVTIGKGDKLTNPIWEGDVASIVVDAIAQPNAEIEAGGKQVYSRHELNQIIQQIVRPEKKVRHVPVGLFRFFIAMMKPFDRNGYDKFAFFGAVSQHDTVAPKVGEKTFKAYITERTKQLYPLNGG